jgi:hypothetical protein
MHIDHPRNLRSTFIEPIEAQLFVYLVPCRNVVESSGVPLWAIASCRTWWTITTTSVRRTTTSSASSSSKSTTATSPMNLPARIAPKTRPSRHGETEQGSRDEMKSNDASRINRVASELSAKTSHNSSPTPSYETSFFVSFYILCYSFQCMEMLRD